MIKSHVILVTEVDEPEDALAEVREKLSGLELLKNTIGIITIHSDFVTSKVYQAIADYLPFPIAGMTTAAQSSNGEIGLYMFSILVLTSDDCHYVCGNSETIRDGEDAVPQIKKCYSSLRAELNEQPKLALVYTPLMTFHFPGEYINAIAEVDPKVPVFGAVANDGRGAFEHRNSFLTLCNGGYYDNSVVIVLIAGEITPEFISGSLTEESVVLHNIGEITKCDKNILAEINDIKAADFFEKVGFVMGEASNMGLLTSTIILDLNKNSDIKEEVVSRTPFMIDNGAVVTGGYLYEGASISVAISTPDVVVQTATEVTEKIKGMDGASTAIMYSCAGRRISLMSDAMRELETIKGGMPEQVNYTLGYASGELCPTAVSDEKSHNHEHNQTIIACVF